MGQQTVRTNMRYEADPTKGSRFIVTITPAADEHAARLALASVSAEMPDASHHCSAWRIARPSIDRCSDDGEPGGSAGRPILAQLTGRNLVDVSVIVTRYFGGTKLGVGGLVRAYGGAAGEALDRCDLVPWLELTQISIDHDYADGDDIERAITSFAGRTINTDYGSGVTRTVEIAVDRLDAFAAALGDATAGRVMIDPAEPA